LWLVLTSFCSDLSDTFVLIEILESVHGYFLLGPTSLEETTTTMGLTGESRITSSTGLIELRSFANRKLKTKTEF